MISNGMSTNLGLKVDTIGMLVRAGYGEKEKRKRMKKSGGRWKD